MGAIAELNNRLQSFVKNIESEVDTAVRSADYLLLDINRKHMKDNQQTSNDTNIIPAYSPYWAAEKNLTYPNLFSTGDFQKKLLLTVASPNYIIKSTDWKNEKLTLKYGDEIFGIAPSNQTQAHSITNKAIGKALKSKVFLKS